MKDTVDTMLSRRSHLSPLLEVALLVVSVVGVGAAGELEGLGAEGVGVAAHGEGGRGLKRGWDGGTEGVTGERMVSGLDRESG